MLYFNNLYIIYNVHIFYMYTLSYIYFIYVHIIIYVLEISQWKWDKEGGELYIYKIIHYLRYNSAQHIWRGQSNHRLSQPTKPRKTLAVSATLQFLFAFYKHLSFFWPCHLACRILVPRNWTEYRVLTIEPLEIPYKHPFYWTGWEDMLQANNDASPPPLSVNLLSGPVVRQTVQHPSRTLS